MLQATHKSVHITGKLFLYLNIFVSRSDFKICLEFNYRTLKLCSVNYLCKYITTKGLSLGSILKPLH